MLKNKKKNPNQSSSIHHSKAQCGLGITLQYKANDFLTIANEETVR